MSSARHEKSLSIPYVTGYENTANELLPSYLVSDDKTNVMSEVLRRYINKKISAPLVADIIKACERVSDVRWHEIFEMPDEATFRYDLSQILDLESKDKISSYKTKQEYQNPFFRAVIDIFEELNEAKSRYEYNPDEDCFNRLTHNLIGAHFTLEKNKNSDQTIVDKIRTIFNTHFAIQKKLICGFKKPTSPEIIGTTKPSENIVILDKIEFIARRLQYEGEHSFFSFNKKRKASIIFSALQQARAELKKNSKSLDEILHTDHGSGFSVFAALNYNRLPIKRAKTKSTLVFDKFLKTNARREGYTELESILVKKFQLVNNKFDSSPLSYAIDPNDKTIMQVNIWDQHGASSIIRDTLVKARIDGIKKIGYINEGGGLFARSAVIFSVEINKIDTIMQQLQKIPDVEIPKSARQALKIPST